MSEISKSDRLKPLESVCSPDPRMTSYVRRDARTGEMRPWTLEDFYAEVESISLRGSVPANIRIHFETARNLLLYSWFVYRFFQVAEMQAYASLEFALKERIGKEKSNLSHNLQYAVEQGWIRDDGFEYYKPSPEPIGEPSDLDANRPPTPVAEPQSRSRVVAQILPKFRNELAHGSSMLAPTGLFTLGVCADVINQLFDSK